MIEKLFIATSLPWGFMLSVSFAPLDNQPYRGTLSARPATPQVSYLRTALSFEGFGKMASLMDLLAV